MDETNQPQERKLDPGLIAMWGLGLFFLFASAADFLWGSPSEGCFGFVIACLLLPPSRAFFHRKTHLSISTGLRTLLCIVLFMVGGAISKPKVHFAHKVHALTSTTPTGLNKSETW